MRYFLVFLISVIITVFTVDYLNYRGKLDIATLAIKKNQADIKFNYNEFFEKDGKGLWWRYFALCDRVKELENANTR